MISLGIILRNWFIKDTSKPAELYRSSCIIDIVYLPWQAENRETVFYLELAELILSSDIFLGLALPFTLPSFSKVAFSIPELESVELLLKTESVTWPGNVPFLVKVELRASLLDDVFLSNVVFNAFWLSVRLSKVLLKVPLALSSGARDKSPSSSFSYVVFRIFSSSLLAPKFRR